MKGELPILRQMMDGGISLDRLEPTETGGPYCDRIRARLTLRDPSHLSTEPAATDKGIAMRKLCA